jgi:hypothetical protein
LATPTQSKLAEVMMKRKLTLLLCFFTLFLSLGHAHAQAGSDTTQPAASGLSAAGDPSPAGCVGKSNNPHKTGSNIKGLTQIDCDDAVDELQTTAQLWRKRWWGYEKVGKKGDQTNHDKFGVKAGGIYGECENNKWRTEGEHWSDEDGVTYYAHTFRYNTVTSC